MLLEFKLKRFNTLVFKFCEVSVCEIPNDLDEKFRQTFTPLKCQNYIKKLNEVIIYF